MAAYLRRSAADLERQQPEELCAGRVRFVSPEASGPMPADPRR
jgi:hypothetical protein